MRIASDSCSWHVVYHSRVSMTVISHVLVLHIGLSVSLIHFSPPTSPFVSMLPLLLVIIVTAIKQVN